MIFKATHSGDVWSCDDLEQDPDNPSSWKWRGRLDADLARKAVVFLNERAKFGTRNQPGTLKEITEAAEEVIHAVEWGREYIDEGWGKGSVDKVVRNLREKLGR